MKLMHGDMWDVLNSTDHWIFTGNAIVKQNGALVMGRGLAREVRDTFPGIDTKLGTAVRTRMSEHYDTICQIYTEDGVTPPDFSRYYGLILGKRIGIFQVKRSWADQADPDLIQRAGYALCSEAWENPNKRYDMNFPGIGNGGLPYEQVYELVKDYPDNIHLWTFQ